MLRPTTFRVWSAGFAALLLLASPALSQSLAPPSASLTGFDKTVAIEIELGSDDWRIAKLAASPRRHDLVTITRGAKKLDGFVVYPATGEKRPVVLMMPEDQGLNNWARDMADEVAAMGYIVIVPDILSGMGPNGGGRSSYPDLRSAMAAHSSLTQNPAAEPVMTADLNAWADFANRMPQSNGKLGALGFAWGAGRIFNFATQRKDLSSVFIFYDAAPPAEKVVGVTAPVYGFYAAIDPRVTRSLDGTKAALTAAGKSYETVVYPESDHMFVRLGEEPRDKNPANIVARHQSLARLQDLLGRM